MIHHIIVPLIMAHCLFSIVYLLLNKKKPAVYVIIIFIAILMVHLGSAVNPKPGHPGPVIPLLNQSYLLLIGPALYFYTLYLIKDVHRLRRINWLHLLPFVVFNIVLSFMLAPPPPPTAANFVRPAHGPPIGIQLFQWSVVLSFLIYQVLIYLAIKRNAGKAKDFYSFKSREVTLNWMLILTGFFAFLLVATLVIEMVSLNQSRLAYPNWLYPTAHLLFAYALSFFSFKQIQLYTPARARLQKSTTNHSGEDDHETPKAHLNKNWQEATEKLERVIQRDKPFLDGQLRITDLAKTMDMPNHQLSKMINERYGKNFFQYVNDFRIEHAKALLKDEAYAHYSIAAIGYESGFNSKSSFNSSFKKNTGVTPSEYKKRFSTF